MVSEERNTGKSTFLNFLKAVFQNNVTFNTNEDFRSQFNADWAGKLLIVVDEVLLNRREDSERLKNLSTTLSYKVEAKGKDRDEISFFAKFVLCSNNELPPVIIDVGETRYWVRKINRLESDDTEFLQKLKAEIPAFLYFLQHRTLSTHKESRMWFAPQLTFTPALQRIIRSNRNKLELEMSELCLDIMEMNNVEEVSFCINDMMPLLSNTQCKYDKGQIRRIVQDIWKLTPVSNTLTYTTYQLSYNAPQYTLLSEEPAGSILLLRSSLRVSKQFYIHYFDEMMNRLYKTFSTSRLRSHLLFIVDILLMKKEKDDILLFVSDSILKNSMMRA